MKLEEVKPEIYGLIFGIFLLLVGYLLLDLIITIEKLDFNEFQLIQKIGSSTIRFILETLIMIFIVNRIVKYRDDIKWVPAKRAFARKALIMHKALESSIERILFILTIDFDDSGFVEEASSVSEYYKQSTEFSFKYGLGRTPGESVSFFHLNSDVSDEEGEFMNSYFISYGITKYAFIKAFDDSLISFNASYDELEKIVDMYKPAFDSDIMNSVSSYMSSHEDFKSKFMLLVNFAGEKLKGNNSEFAICAISPMEQLEGMQEAMSRLTKDTGAKENREVYMDLNYFLEKCLLCAEIHRFILAKNTSEFEEYIQVIKSYDAQVNNRNDEEKKG